MWCITVARHRGCHQVTYSVSLLSSWHLLVSLILSNGSIEDRSVNSSKAGFLSLAKSWPTYIIKYLMWYGTDCLLLFSKSCDPKINLFCSWYSHLRCLIIFINKKWIFHFFCSEALSDHCCGTLIAINENYLRQTANKMGEKWWGETLSCFLVKHIEHKDDHLRRSDYQRLWSTSPKLNVLLLLSSSFSSAI